MPLEGAPKADRCDRPASDCDFYHKDCNNCPYDPDKKEERKSEQYRNKQTK